MRHLNIILIILMLAFIPVACGDKEEETPEYSTATLSGVWVVNKDGFTNTYFIFDGFGTITDAGRFGFTGGTYSITSDGSFALNTGSQIFTGQLSDDATGIVTIDNVLCAITKLPDTSVCGGAWSGSLTDLYTATATYVSFTIDSSGNVSSFTGLASPVSGKVYCSSSSLIGFLRTGETTSYAQILLNGTIYSNMVSGTYLTNSTSIYYDGTLSLIHY